jgi:hypothetical protein
MQTAGVLLLLVLSGPQAGVDDHAAGSMSIPVSLAELAAAAGLRRADPSTLPVDIVRSAFAAPDHAPGESAARRAAIRRVLATRGSSGDRLPLPLNPLTWRKHLLGADVADDRLAAAIFSRRATALLYHGLFALDPPTLEWMDANPSVLDTLLKHPGITATLARSIHVRNGSIVTPGEDASGVWKAIVGADPRDPEAFIARLITSREGNVAAFYDAVTHLDAARQRFALGLATDVNRIGRVRRLLDAATPELPAARLEDYPFMRLDVDVSLLFRRLGLDARGVAIGPSKRVWAGVFGEAKDLDGAIDAAWLATAILKPGGAAARRRLDTFCFAQRALASDAGADTATLVSALQDFPRYPILMLTLEANGYRSAAAYAAAGRAAAALGRDEDAIALFQGGLAIVDRARQAGTLSPAGSQKLIDSLIKAATASPARGALLAWLQHELPWRWGAGAETTLLKTLAGPAPERPALIDWEGQQYSVDLAQSELRRLTSIRRAQEEPPLEDAIATATSARLSPVVNSLEALVYAMALGEPDSQASNGGQVWRRHRIDAAPSRSGDSAPAWRVATELFDTGGWHVTGSLLRLDLALAPLSLRRIDMTDMPGPSSISTLDRLTLARTVPLMDPLAIGDEARDAAAAALARGRGRVADLAAGHSPAGAMDAIATQAPLSEWRLAGIRWLLAHDAARVPGAFTELELFRLGGGMPAPGWGAVADPLDGCLCLRMPDFAPWEEYTGRSATGQLGSQFADVMLRTAEGLSTRHLPATLMRNIAAFAVQDAMDAGRPGYPDDWLSLAFAARDLKDDRFDDYVAALTASGPLVPVKTVPK